jgi:hypothetical protein
MSHIIHQDSRERESVATHRLLATMPLRERVFGELGAFSWFIMELRFSTLGLEGDGEIDILGGRLAPTDHAAYRVMYEEEARRLPSAPPQFVDWMATKRYVEEGGIAWPPRTDFLIGVEVKCAYEKDGEIKSKKDSPEKLRDLHKQLRRDLDLGLDYVGLLDILANEPATGDGSDAWWHATSKSFESFQKMRPTLDQRLPSDLPVGHWAWSVGAVIGGDETMRGAGGPRQLREAVHNERTPQRARVDELLAQLLTNLPRPRTWPVLLKDCRNCGALHPFHEFSDYKECTR